VSETAPSRALGPTAGLDAVYAEHGRFLWGLCYRLTGCAADADDLLQSTFVRAIERPPDDTDAPWRPWLVRVALNLGRDQLRRRRRRRYVGPWLPSPIEAGDEEAPGAVEATLAGGGTTEGRYDLLESVSFAFLLALEALTPKQRAVLLLRDVFDYSVAETAAALDASENDIKVTHHRARRAMRAYDRARCRPTRELQESTRAVLTRFLQALGSGDAQSVEHLLADSVRAVSDGGGEFFAARVPIVGRERVARFYTNLSQRQLVDVDLEVRMMNGLPGIVFERPPVQGERQAIRVVTLIELGPDGRVSALRSVLATRKLTAIAPAAANPARGAGEITA
jgi:RNA polymerase sigma factor (sigma-70 family)